MKNTNPNEKRIFKWWWGWNPEKIEKWLEEQEMQGWNLINISKLGLNFTFEKGRPRRMSYCIDYQPSVKEDYHQLCQDSGWILAGSGSGWYYWGQKYSGEKPNLFSDYASLIERNRRMAWLFLILMPSQLPGFNFMLTRLHETHSLVLKMLFGFQCTVFLCMVFVLIMFLRANLKLKRQSQKNQF